MIVHDATSAEIYVFTFKAGVLSRVAHDLKLRVTELELTWAEDDAGVGEIRLRASPRSLRVVCAMRKGKQQPNALSSKDCADIERNVHTDVLQPTKFPEIRFASQHVEQVKTDRYRITGELMLHGARRMLETFVERRDDVWQADIPLHQPDFGIKPYSAMLGSIRIKSRLMVQVRVPDTFSKAG